MAPPALNSVYDAKEDSPGRIVMSSFPNSESDTDDNCDQAPPSPELGMGSPNGSEDGSLELEDTDEQDAANVESSAVPIGELQGDESVTRRGSEKPVKSLPRRSQTQQSPPGSTQRASDSETAQLMTPVPTCPPIRRSARTKSTLLYDQKYHPMDDFIRPSQAAKRRSLHGEQHVLRGDSDSGTPEDSGSGVVSIAGEEISDDDKDELQPAQGRKRKRTNSLTPETTRRSSRKRTNPKMSYNMNIHPQDSDLKRVCACDGSQSSPSPTKPIGSAEATSPKRVTSSIIFEDVCRTLLVDDSEDSLSKSTQEPPWSATHPSAREPDMKQSKGTTDTYPALRSDIAYISADQEMWPALKGLPFQIFTEHIEDQLSAEAEAASPFHYEDDDKENDVTNPELVPRPNPLDGISIIPASHYRRAPGIYTALGPSSVASNAFYVHPHFEASPYGLGWADGAHDTGDGDTHDCLVPEYMRILASGEHLPQTSTTARNHRPHGDINVASSSLVQGFEDRGSLR